MEAGDGGSERPVSRADRVTAFLKDGRMEIRAVLCSAARSHFLPPLSLDKKEAQPRTLADKEAGQAVGSAAPCLCSNTATLSVCLCCRGADVEVSKAKFLPMS
ncbi:hypothetical protein AAFF_G00237170 [Aldrovandia affinis]|uniref:Uncharacterized protein n=1 Tax=Aldrovandia affinis TaxID=143900 RepID=A0AAD7W450_9TELE|nr:hypothetical protein AAFF_G00237170 [Aldrovandia affinis]